MSDQHTKASSAQKTVLITEDEDRLARAIAATLRAEGLETVIARNGSEALSLAHRLHPDLILLDVMMFGMSGFEVCSRLTADPETSDIPVIFVTAKTAEEDRALGMAAGARAYVTKPFEAEELIELTNQVLANEAADKGPEPSAAASSSPDKPAAQKRDLQTLWRRERQRRQALEAAHERLAAMDQLKASFISAVTQELLTPFPLIGTILENLQRKSIESSAAFQDDLNDLVAAIAGLYDRIQEVVEVAVSVSKRRQPYLGYHAMDEIVPQAVEPVAVTAQAQGVDFRVFVPSDLPKGHVDASLVGEAVRQMAHNAVTFNRSGGHAELSAYASGDMIVIEVSDTGIGLTSEQLERLRHPFQLKGEAAGEVEQEMAVYWAFVCYVAEAHGGWTEVSSAGKGKGSTFSLALPAA